MLRMRPNSRRRRPCLDDSANGAFTPISASLALDAREQLRPDLRILVMSATLDGLTLSTILENVPVIRSEGRAYPIETIYRPSAVDGPIEPAVAATTRRALSETEGDLLVFLPGRRELQRTRDLLMDGTLPDHVHVHLLHGEMAWNDQLIALALPEPGRRKVILATSIAETSLTIDGVRVVIDSGLARVPRFDPRRMSDSQLSRFRRPLPINAGDGPDGKTPGSVTGSGPRNGTMSWSASPRRRFWKRIWPRLCSIWPGGDHRTDRASGSWMPHLSLIWNRPDSCCGSSVRWTHRTD
jgi:hypothetical protein